MFGGGVSTRWFGQWQASPSKGKGLGGTNADRESSFLQYVEWPAVFDTFYKTCCVLHCLKIGGRWLYDVLVFATGCPSHTCWARIMGNFSMAVGCGDSFWKGTILGRRLCGVVVDRDRMPHLRLGQGAWDMLVLQLFAGSGWKKSKYLWVLVLEDPQVMRIVCWDILAVCHLQFAACRGFLILLPWEPFGCSMRAECFSRIAWVGGIFVNPVSVVMEEIGFRVTRLILLGANKKGVVFVLSVLPGIGLLATRRIAVCTKQKSCSVCGGRNWCFCNQTNWCLCNRRNCCFGNMK